MITKLTKEQEKGISEWRDHCLKIGRDTSPINKELTEKSWNKFYKILDKNEPMFWYCQSPLQAQIIINIFPEIVKLVEEIPETGANIGNNIRDNIWANIGANIEDNIWGKIWNNPEKNIENKIRGNIGVNIRGDTMDKIWSSITKDICDNICSKICDNICEMKLKYIDTYSWCQHDINWIAYYKYFNKYGLLPTDDNFKIFDIWYDLACSCGWCYTFENIVFVCEKPCELNLDNQGRLHKDGDMALKYSDGYGLYMLNGIQVPEYLVMTSESDLNMDFYNKEKNSDIRTEFVRKYGVERMLSLGKKIDSYENYNEDMWTKSEYELWDMNCLFEGVNFAPHLKMKNQSVDVIHVEPVSPEARNLPDAIKERLNNKQLVIREIR